MTRSIDSIFLSALQTNRGIFIAKVEIKRGTISATVNPVKSFEIDEGNLTAKVTISYANKPATINPQPFNDTIFQISRGLNISGVDYYLASSWFVLQQIEENDLEITYQGHIFKSIRYSTAGNIAVNALISNFLANSYVTGLNYSNTITYPTDVEWWKTIKFFPVNSNLILQNLQTFTNLLKQKYILTLIDIGGNVLVPHDNGQINQYEPITPEIVPITTVIDFKLLKEELPSKYYIWQDELGVIHTAGSSSRPMHNLGYIESTVTPFLLDEYNNTKSRVTLSPPDLRLTASDYIRITSPNGNTIADWYRIKETFNPDKTPSWFQTLESIRLLENTEGGSIPTNLNASIKYSSLETGNFNNILSENENNTQAALEALDDHNHYELSGTYTPTRSAEANLDSNVIMFQAQFLRVGNTVTVSGRFTADPTLAATATSFEMTLPISSNLGAAEDLAGVAFCGNIASMGAEIIGSPANNTAKVQWKSNDITSQTWSFIFTYQVI